MNAIGFLPFATGVLALIGAGICLRRAADPIGALRRMKQLHGIDYPRMISDPHRYAERVERMSGLSGAFLIVVGLVMTVAGVAGMAAPSPEEQRAHSAAVQEEMRRSDEQMRESFRKQDEERRKHFWDGTPENLRK